MARAIERIEQDITALKQTIKAIATELHSNYGSYLALLGEALQKQLILAAYYLCTQGYPDSFKNLSLNQRQKLQQGIRKLGKEGAVNLLLYFQVGKTEEIEQTQEEELEAVEEIEEIEEIEDMEETEEIEEDENEQQLNSENKKYLDPSNPIELLKWHQDLEEIIQNTLRKISHDANSLLQKSGILPKKLPEPILAAAAAAASEASAEVMPGPPNILNLVIEISSEQESEESNLTPLMTINLRLGDMEFADSNLLSSRKQIRNILLQLNKLGKDYQKKQRELKVAEAEAAWRASWFED